MAPALDLAAHDLGRRYGRQWIFRHLSCTLTPGSATAVLGPNGAGKSTLLSILAGQLLPTEGRVSYALAGRPLPVAEMPRQLAYCAPYLELPEEFTLLELLAFHTRLKPLRAGVSVADLLDIMYLHRARHQAVRTFSSGMKQRLKLGLALYAAAPLLLLDEPTTNLDATGAAWYQAQVAEARRADAGRVVVVSSNVPAEYSFCEAAVRITDFQ
ncbi:ATP-binding cassette domain-containing protein [Hymenobacter sp. RP-2-7]|uniref:ATP-binding cassette domain-containing protein n=1 Tax=Hymenobacter polaris TaxID=2682546 RepID=A0A7Y0FL52_9BACT|nr:ATP-binding cassette domain-containing protein [Hymenobacter polaris]NML64004.1 ATP-binding cassette domain-containing protein [Hymenobacter polaris]